MTDIEKILKSAETRGQDTEVQTEEEATEGAMEWHESDKELFKYQAEMGKVVVYAKEKTSGNQVFFFEVQGTKGIYFKTMHDGGPYDIIQNDKTTIGYAVSKSGPIYLYQLIREDDNVYLKEKTMINPQNLPRKYPSIIQSYKIQLKGVKYYKLKSGEIVFYEESSKEILFYMTAPSLIVQGEEYTNTFGYEIREEGINIFIDLYIYNLPTLPETEDLFVEIDPTILTTTDGRTGEHVELPNYYINIALCIAVLAGGFFVLLRYYKKLSREVAEAKLKVARTGT